MGFKESGGRANFPCIWMRWMSSLREQLGQRYGRQKMYVGHCFGRKKQ